MNWFKKAQHNEPPEWNYPGAEHDYNPSWDYEIDTSPDQNIVNFVNNYIEKIKKDILPETGFIQDIKPAFIKGDNNYLAKYINGTYSHTIIVVNIEAIKEASKKYKVNIEDTVETTILHELAHAIQDGTGLEFNEEQAEDFAYNYHVLGYIDKFWEDNNDNIKPFPRSLPY